MLRTRRPILLFSLVIAVGLVITLLMSLVLFDYAREQSRLRIERHVEARAEQLQFRIHSSLQTLVSLAGFIHASDTVTLNEFRRFVSVSVRDRESIIALAWVPIVTDEERDEFEQGIAGRGARGRHIHDLNSHGLVTIATRQSTYFPIRFLYERIHSYLFPGLNLGTQYKIRKRLERAAQNDRVLVTSAVELRRGQPGLKTFQAFKPVYNQDSGSQRDPAGFVFAQIDIESLVRQSFGRERMFLLALFDLDAETGDQLLFIDEPGNPDRESVREVSDLQRFYKTYWDREFTVGDRTWLMAFTEPGTTAGAMVTWLPYLGFIIGLLLTAMLALYIFITQMRAQELDRLRKDSEAKSRFLQAVGHDLRQPLNVIGVYLSRFEQDHKADPESPQFALVNQVRQGLRGLNNMFTSLLDITRLEAGMIQPRMKPVRLLPLMTDLGDEFDLLASQKGIDFRLRCQDLVMDTDEILLERILRNLLTNAVKYTDQGRILCAVRSVGNQIRFYIMDTGSGIAPDQLQEIMEPYQRGGRGGDTDGLGLGLAIVQQTTRLLGMQLEVSSREGKGTCFLLQAPCKTKNVAMLPAHARVTAAAGDGNILLVGRDTATALLKHLATWDYRVDRVHDLNDITGDRVSRYRVAIICADGFSGEEGSELVGTVSMQFDSNTAVIVVGNGNGSTGLYRDAGYHYLPHPPALLKLKSLLQFLCRRDDREAGPG